MITARQLDRLRLAAYMIDRAEQYQNSSPCKVALEDVARDLIDGTADTRIDAGEVDALRAKEGDVAAMEAMIVAFMFATIAHPHGSLVKIKISYPYKFAPNLAALATAWRARSTPKQAARL